MIKNWSAYHSLFLEQLIVNGASTTFTERFAFIFIHSSRCAFLDRLKLLLSGRNNRLTEAQLDFILWLSCQFAVWCGSLLRFFFERLAQKWRWASHAWIEIFGCCALCYHLPTSCGRFERLIFGRMQLFLADHSRCKQVPWLPWLALTLSFNL